MIKRVFFLAVITCFLLSNLYSRGIPVQWHTFWGSWSEDVGFGIARDDSDNIYVTGFTAGSWGSPINPYAGHADAFVAKLNKNGNLIWNTFLGSSKPDLGLGICLDNQGRIFVTGESFGSWGAPVNPHSGKGDIFVAVLDSNGNLIANTFLGSSQSDVAYAIAGDGSGTVYVTGYSESTWGSPFNSHAGNYDIFIAVLDVSCNLVGNTFLGSSHDDYGYAITVDSSGKGYVTGTSFATWGSPVNAHSGDGDAFVACVSKSGNLIWNTFLGCSFGDSGRGIVVDDAGKVFVTGESYEDWGTPINSHTSGFGDDVFVAALNSSTGVILWNTFQGSAGDDWSNAMTMDSAGNLYITGMCEGSWGYPINDFNGGRDAFVSTLNSSGELLWNAYVGSDTFDECFGITLSSSGGILVTGFSDASWGSPLNPYNNNGDILVARLGGLPIPNITANGSENPIMITESDELQINISLAAHGSTANVDFWLIYLDSYGWHYFDYESKSWRWGHTVSHQGSLFDINDKMVFRASGLEPGPYYFLFGVDLKMDGKLTKSLIIPDAVYVEVIPD